MGNLVLELKPGEMMIINGAPIRFRSKSTIELAGRARFLFGKQLMAAHEADSPARRIYFAIQAVYIGTEAERPAARAQLDELVTMFRDSTTLEAARILLDLIETSVQADDCYGALKLARRLIRDEEAVPRPASD